MNKIDLYRKMLEEERISEEELLSLCTEEELEQLFPSEESLLHLKEEKLNEVLSLITVRNSYADSGTQIGFHAKKDDEIVDYLHKTMLKLLKELYGE